MGKYKHISLFSGCGGFDLGFKQAGYENVFANDIDKDAQAVYRLNIGSIDGRDIADIDADDIPDGDVLTAGFPCQPFSNAGRRKGITDPRGLLYRECFRIIKAKKPKAVVFENVRGLLSSKGPDEIKLAESIYADFVCEGYRCEYKLINAANYGVPQNRYRVFFTALRDDLGINPTFPMQTHLADDTEKLAELTLGKLLDITSNINNQVDWPLSPQAAELAKHIPEGGSWKDVPYVMLPSRLKRIRDNMKKYHSPNFYRRFARSEVCGTITAQAQPEKCGILHPTENRRFNVREVARIQTFPDSFQFITDTAGDVKAMYRVIGNAVPVRLAWILAGHIAEALR